MNFDFGDVFGRAWQITRKHKALWVFSALPMVLGIFYLPFVFYLFLSNDFPNNIPVFFHNPISIVIIFIAVVLTAAIGLVLQVFSRAATTFGLIRIVEERANPTLHDISKGGRAFFWRILGAMLLVSVGMMAVFAALSACLSLAGFVTFGIGSLIGQLIFLPLTLLFYALMEQAQVAVVRDALSPTDAIEHAWELIKENIGIFALVTVILYFGFSVLSSITMLPVIGPLLIVVLNRFSSALSNPSLLWISVLCFVVFLPLYLVFQAVAMLYMKAVHVITYLRLTHSPKLQPLLQNGEATS